MDINNVSFLTTGKKFIESEFFRSTITIFLSMLSRNYEEVVGSYHPGGCFVASHGYAVIKGHWFSLRKEDRLAVQEGGEIIACI